eukprot:5667436-Pyramimonas_sp.AAC.1
MDLPQLQVASFIATTMADKLVQRDADKAKAGFADWIAENHARGTGALHSWTKPPQGWQARPSGAPGSEPRTLSQTVQAL